jgi:HNH endonuclease
MSAGYSTTLLCTQCYKPFRRFASELQGSRYPFCTRKCQHAFQHIQGLLHYIVVTCAFCSAEIACAPSRKKLGGRCFCRRACKRSYDEDIPARFWEKVQRGSPEECWPWLAAIDPGSGYGAFSYARAMRKFLPLEKVGNAIAAHRVAFFLHHGSLPPDLNICHTCDYRPCCNFHHLFAGTQAENLQDMVSKGRAASGERHGSKIHPNATLRGERHPNARFSAEDVAAMRRMKQENPKMSYRTIGAIFNTAAATAWLIITGRSRKHESPELIRTKRNSNRLRVQ